MFNRNTRNLGETLREANAVGYEALVRQVGMLAKRRREEIGLSPGQLVKETGIESDEILLAFENGKNLPPEATQRKLEKALDWKLGVIGEVIRMTDRPAGTLTMEELDAEDSLYLASRGVLPSLSLVSDGDLLVEVARRGLLATRPGASM